MDACAHPHPQQQVRGLVRATLHEGPLGRVDHLCCGGHLRAAGPEEHATQFQFVLLLGGSFLWRCGRREVFADANHAICITAHEDYRIAHPVAGDECLVITPSADVLEEWLGRPHARLHQADCFRRGAMTIAPRDQLLASRALRAEEPLAMEEIVLELCGRLAHSARLSPPVSAATASTVRRARQLLAETFSESWTLGEIARQVSVSPAHLTTSFRRITGMPLHRYRQHLRLAASLRRLADAPDLAQLALDLGFSSQSHFTNVFRQAYGVPPGALRRGALPPRPQ